MPGRAPSWRLAWFGAALACFLLAAPFVAFAEEAKEAEAAKLPPAPDRAKALTAKMKEKLQLTDEQEAKVAEINLRAAEAVDRATALPGAGRVDRFQSVRAAQTERDNELKGVLTQDQWKKYKKLKDEFKDEVSAKKELMKKKEY